MVCEVIENDLGNGLTAILVAIDGEKCIRLRDLASLLGVSESDLRHIVRRNGLMNVTLSHNHRTAMKAAGLVGNKTNNLKFPLFFNQSTVESLVKIVNTPAAWAIYRQLWQVAKEVHII